MSPSVVEPPAAFTPKVSPPKVSQVYSPLSTAQVLFSPHYINFHIDKEIQKEKTVPTLSVFSWSLPCSSLPKHNKKNLFSKLVIIYKLPLLDICFPDILLRPV